MAKTLTELGPWLTLQRLRFTGRVIRRVSLLKYSWASRVTFGTRSWECFDFVGIVCVGSCNCLSEKKLSDIGRRGRNVMIKGRYVWDTKIDLTCPFSSDVYHVRSASSRGYGLALPNTFSHLRMWEYCTKSSMWQHEHTKCFSGSPEVSVNLCSDESFEKLCNHKQVNLVETVRKFHASFAIWFARLKANLLASFPRAYGPTHSCRYRLVFRRTLLNFY